MPSRSNLQATYPRIETRDEDWRAFFRTQVWKDIKYILEQDAEYGLQRLLGDTVQDTNEVNKLRGKLEAYREIIRLDENISDIMKSEEEEEPEEEKEEEDES